MFGFFSARNSIEGSGLVTGFIDNHSHILYGVDDGVQTKEDSLKILSYLEHAGAVEVWLTPHVMEDVPNTTSSLKARFEELKDSYNGVLKLNLASENMIDSLFFERLKTMDFLFHGDGKLLVETSTWSAPMDFWDILDTLLVRGCVPIIAHPERYRYMDMNDYSRLLDMGTILQLNLPSIIGVYGEDVRRKAQSLLAKGMYAMTGTDCHRFNALHIQFTSSVLTRSEISALSALMKV